MSFFATPRGSGLRLIGLPNAGGGTADFRRWRIPGVDVLPACLAGRETRLSERPTRSLPVLVDDLADALPTSHPYVLYGHSMGAWLAFELTRTLRRRGDRLPLRLMVGARHAPHLPTTTPPLGRLPQAAFLEGMQKRYGAIPDVLLAEPDLLRTFLPALRADVVMLDDYRYTEEPPLDLPIDVFHASDDPTVTHEQADAWRIHTTGPFALHTVTGGHFFLREPGFPDRIASLL